MVAVALVAGGAVSAHAAVGDASRASGQFLSGSLVQSVAAQLAGVSVSNDGTQATQTASNPLNATVLSSLSVQAPGGVTVPLSLADVGALSSFAQARSDGGSIGASGLVSNSGAIGVGAVPAGQAPGDLTLDLSNALGPAFASELSTLTVQAGAVSARASATGDAMPTGSYEIAGLRMSVKSATIAAIPTRAAAATATLQTSVDGLRSTTTGITSGLLAAVRAVLPTATGLSNTTVGLSVDLQSAVDAELMKPLVSADGGVTLDPASGIVTLDLARLVPNLTALPPNSPLLSSAVLTTVTTDVDALVRDLDSRIRSAVTAALNSATVTVETDVRPLAHIRVVGTLAQISAGTAAVTITALGLPVPLLTAALVLGALKAPVDAVISPTVGALAIFTTSITAAVVTPVIGTLDPLLRTLGTVVSLTANVQAPSPGLGRALFTETALRIALLARGPVTALAALDLATATVGPNAAAPVPPAITSVAPDHGPRTGGSAVVLTGSGLGGATAVSFGGTPAASFTVDSATRISAVAPPHAVGSAPITVTGPGGDSAALPFTFDPVTTIVSIAPTTGPAGGGSTVVVSGSCFQGATAVTFGGVAAASFTVDSDTRITAVTPAGTGAADVAVVGGGACGTATLPAAFVYGASPAVTALSPAIGPTAGGTVVTLTGSGLASATGVAFGGDDGSVLTVVDDTTITVRAPAHAAGAVPVLVRSPYGTADAGSFDYRGPASVGSLSPASGPTVGGTVVTVTGTGLAGATGVSFGGVPGTGLVVDGDTGLRITAPAHPAGPVSVAVAGPGGTGSSGTFTYLPPATVAGVTPSAGPIAGSTVVTIDGSGFAGATAVAFGGVPATDVTVVSDTRIRATTPAHAAGATAVVVAGPGGSDVAGTFLFVAPPTIATVAPDRGGVAGGTVVTLTGSGFTGATGAAFGGTPGTSFQAVDDSTLRVTSPAHIAGATAIVVQGPYGAASTGFTFVPEPVVTALAPVSGPIAGGTVVTIAGTGLAQTAAVTFGGIPAALLSVSDTAVRVSSPANPAGSVEVVVAGAGTTTDAGAFTYRGPAVVSALAPSAGPTAGGTVVTLTGSGFTGATGVDFGGTAATALVVVDDGTLRATAPAHPAGAVAVTVAGPNGSGAAGAFAYVAPPLVTSLGPTAGPDVGGTTVTIRGTGFTPTTAVDFGGVVGSSFTVVDDATITVVAPAHVAGSSAVVVRGPFGDAVAGDFAFLPTADIRSIAPAIGPIGGGTAVTITGTGLGDATAVTFDGVAGTGLTVIDATTLRVTAPAHAAGDVDVAVQGPAGVGATGVFRYVAPPTVSIVAPLAGPAAGGTRVTISGSALDGVDAVEFDGVPGSDLVVSGPGTLAVTTPAHAAGRVTVALRGRFATDASASFTYLDAAAATSVSPGSGPIAGGTAVTITGSGFTDATAVTFGGVPAGSVAVVDAGTIEAIAPPHPAGSVVVAVQSPGGTGTTASFAYVAPPAIAAVTPPTGPVTGGTTVTIAGSGLAGATGVDFDGTPGTDLVVTGDGSLTVATPPHPVGPVPVVVHGPFDDSTSGAFVYTPVVSIAGATPGTGPAAGGTEVTITGACLAQARAVLFGSTPSIFSVVDDSTIRAIAPSGEGTVSLTVTGSPTCGNATLASAFRYLPAPDVSALAPATGASSGGTVVTVTGSGFAGATGVEFGGTPATGVTVVSDTTIIAIAPPHAPGSVAVAVLSPSGGGAAGSFLYSVATTVAEVTGPAGASGPATGGDVVTITGSCFTGATAVLFGGVAASFVVVDDGTITATVPPGSGSVDLRIVGSETCGTADVAGAWDYRPVPVALSLSPASGPVTGGSVVTITGTGFTGTTGVRFGEGRATDVTVESDTRIVVTAPAHAAGTTDVVVENPVRDADPLAFAFTPAAVVTAVAPSSGPASGGTAVILSGTCLAGATSVTIGGTGVAFEVVSDTAIATVTPAGSGSAAVVVTGAGPCGSTSLAGGFTYLAPGAPVISDVVPGSAPETGGTALTITGTGFTGATEVTVGGAPAGDVVVVDDAVITATAPAHAPGAADVVVTTPVGPSAPAPFDVTAITTIDDVSPDEGPEAGGTAVSISGHGFTGATGVTFGAVPAASVTVVDDTRIDVVTPLGAGTVDVTVVSPTGAATASGAFRYVADGLPVIGDLSPDVGSWIGGTLVTITGDGLAGATDVAFDGVSARSFRVVSRFAIQAVTPTHPIGPVDVAVTTPAGTTRSLARSFRFLPTPTAVAPESGVAGIEVTLTGACFTDAAGATFGGVAASGVRVVDDATLIAVVPPGTGTVPVVVQGSPSCGSIDIGTFAYGVGDVGVVLPPDVAPEDPAGPASGAPSDAATGPTATDPLARTGSDLSVALLWLWAALAAVGTGAALAAADRFRGRPRRGR